jgi:FMNH2-dependent dimethyl sulfone monooxygenase
MITTTTQSLELIATAASPAEFSDSPLSRVLRQPLILGLFLPVQSGGWSASLLPRTTDWTFDYNAALTKRAERLGFDLVFGLAQWTSKGGYGGVSKYREDSLDPFIAVAALSAITDRILLISTIHVLFGPWHPLHLAKFGATIDHISGGRWGITSSPATRRAKHTCSAASKSSTTAATRWPENSLTSSPGYGARPRI